jgi:hypothetical protein
VRPHFWCSAASGLSAVLLPLVITLALPFNRVVAALGYDALGGNKSGELAGLQRVHREWPVLLHGPDQTVGQPVC